MTENTIQRLKKISMIKNNGHFNGYSDFFLVFSASVSKIQTPTISQDSMPETWGNLHDVLRHMTTRLG